jgi:hypothetical protein
MGVFTMTPQRLLPALPQPRVRLDRGFTVHSQWAVERRLATAERELSIQFSRIAQLQAELDLLRASFRRPPAGGRVR